MQRPINKNHTNSQLKTNKYTHLRSFTQSNTTSYAHAHCAQSCFPPNIARQLNIRLSRIAMSMVMAMYKQYRNGHRSYMTRAMFTLTSRDNPTTSHANVKLCDYPRDDRDSEGTNSRSENVTTQSKTSASSLMNAETDAGGMQMVSPSLAPSPRLVPDSSNSSIVGIDIANLLREPCKLLSTPTTTSKSFELSTVTMKLPHSNLTLYSIYSFSRSSTKSWHVMLCLASSVG